MFKFVRPDILYLLTVIPILVLLYLLLLYVRRKSMRRFGNISVVGALMEYMSLPRQSIKFIIYIISFVLMLIALAGPQSGAKVEEVKRKGVEVMIALDVSNSMMAEDIAPNRLERAKLAIDRLIDGMRDDKVGLIVFAGEAFIQVPITNDYISAKMFLKNIRTDMVPVQGTDISKAIMLAVNSFDPKSKAGKAVIVITDGENHQQNAIETAAEASDKNVVVHCIGMGMSQGAPIPVRSGGNKMYMKDKDGNVVVSKLDETLLSKIAASGNGIYVRATTAETGINKIFGKVAGMEKTEQGTLVYTAYDDQYRYFAFMSLILLLIDFCILERKNKLLMNVNLFKRK